MLYGNIIAIVGGLVHYFGRRRRNFYCGGVLNLVRKVLVRSPIDACAANEPRAPNGSLDFASKYWAAGFNRRAIINKAVAYAADRH